MPLAQRRIILVSALVVLTIVAALRFTPAPPRPVANLPKEISDETFWQMIEDFSEPGGFFRSDNFVSNEREFQYVISELKRGRPPGGVYLGVGPDQNFTYVVALEPAIAFIVDIRRQNMIQHLMYKALLELSGDRADFLSRLFSRPRPQAVQADASPEELFAAYEEVTPDRELFDDNLQHIVELLTKRHGFKLTDDDLKNLEYVYTAFFEGGPDLTYSFSAGQGATGASSRFGNGFRFSRSMPSYAELMVATDQEGHNRSYLANAENFKILQDLERRNVLIPIVGDFAGSKALRAVGDYLRRHDATVTAFYTSNVEQYLFQQRDDWSKFYSNVGTLPVDSDSAFIRSVASNRRFQTVSGRASLLCPIEVLLKAFRSHRLDSYMEVIWMSH
jgi:hypothetical protein